MKILAIRGRNLASLAGVFEVDFRREPLGSAGLFAICGRTGSGKSTILDALSVALYDRTPRLARAVRASVLPDVGDETISPSDARTLLRRGAADGFAEVDFAGNDGVEYRARWQVRRARGRAEGKLQPAELSLVRMSDGQRVGALKTEVLAAIEERLGLAFEQFTRAALLAQNEFNAFLNADDNKRAELLELLTGTETYTLISQRAFERAKAERQALDELNRQVAGEQPLDGAARAALEENAAAAASTVAAKEAEATQVEERVRWRQSLEQARADEREAQEDLNAAARDREEAEPRFNHLGLVDAVQPSSQLVHEDARANDGLVDAREVLLPTRERQEQDLRLELVEAEAASARAKAAVAGAEAKEREDAPQLNAARLLDAQIDEAVARHRDAAGTLNESRSACEEACRRRDTVARDRDRCVAERERDRVWLGDHADWARLEAEWPRWDTLLGVAETRAGEVEKAREALASTEAQLSRARAGLDAATRQRAELEPERALLETGLDEAERTLAALDIADLAGERKQVQARLDSIVSARAIDERLRGHRAQQARLEEELRIEDARAVQADANVARLEGERTAAAAVLAKAEATANEVRLAAAANVRKLRASLEEGRPCPVCGAVDHPYVSAEETAPDKSAVHAAERQVESFRKEHDAVVRSLAHEQAAAGQARARTGQLKRDVSELRDKLEEAERTWREHPVGEDTAALPEPDLAAWLQTAAEEASLGLREAVSREAEAALALKARDEARKLCEAARARCQTLERLEAEARTAVETLNASSVAASTSLASADSGLAKVLDELEQAFPPAAGWRDEWRALPERFHDDAGRRAADYRARREAYEKRGERLERFALEIGVLQGSAAQAEASFRQAEDVSQRLEGDLRARRSARAAFFEGRMVADVERGLREARQRSTDARDAAESGLSDARTAHATAATQFEQARLLLGEREARASAARAALGEWLGRFNAGRLPGAPLDVPSLTALLGHDSAWIAGERGALRKLEDAVRQARAVLEERTRRRLQVEVLQLTGEPLDKLRARRDELAEELTAARSGRASLDAQLADDDRRLARCEKLESDIAERESVVALWERMNALLGSADGRRFRNYAQQLTLDVLLAYANRHLSDLARRYSLRRLPESLALIVVDHDMADEVRSAHSLSGGESFLVSLALALGLASLSSNRVRVDSLFIDEGFGALDAETLGIAMDALDRLQGQGRKVGVISHVQELAERIGTRILVEKQSGGRSRVTVAGQVAVGSH